MDQKPIPNADVMQVANILLNFLNGCPYLPARVAFEKLEKRAPAMMMQCLPGAVKLKAYLRGCYIGQFPFGLYIRTDGEDTAGRLDAVSALHAIYGWMRAQSLPTLGDKKAARKIEMTSLPALIARDDSGAQDYQAIFRLEYYKG